MHLYSVGDFLMVTAFLSCYGDVSAFAMASIIVTCSWNKVLVPVLPISPLIVYLKPANFTMKNIGFLLKNQLAIAFQFSLLFHPR
jgi:hypothetical protein